MPAWFAFIRRHPGSWLGLATATLFAVLYLAAAGNGWGYYRHLSQAFLAGRLDVDARLIDPHHLRDFAEFNGRYYYPMGMLPAIMLLPGVAIFGLDFPQGTLVVALAIAIGFLVYRIARRCAWGERDALWLVVAVMLGSPLAYLVLRATVFDAYLAHLLSLAGMLAALVEHLGKRRPWVIGAWLGLATMARPITVLAVIFFLMTELVSAVPGRKKFWRALAMLVPLVIAVASIGGYNALRFGHPLEAGYAYQLIDQNTVLARRLGTFSLRHIPGNFYRALLAGPVPIFAAGSKILLQFPYFTFDGNGTSALLTWPLLLMLFFVNTRAAEVRWSLLAAGAIAVALLLSFATGNHQYGYRYGFDFIPFLLLALVSGLRELGASGRRLIIAGLVVNAWLTLPVLLNLPLPGVTK